MEYGNIAGVALFVGASSAITTTAHGAHPSEEYDSFGALWSGTPEENISAVQNAGHVGTNSIHDIGDGLVGYFIEATGLYVFRSPTSQVQWDQIGGSAPSGYNTSFFDCHELWTAVEGSAYWFNPSNDIWQCIAAMSQ